VSDQGVVDGIQLELFSPLETFSLRGLKFIGLLFLIGGEFYGSFGSTSRGSLMSTTFLPCGRAELHRPECFSSDDWWAALHDNHLKED
jgi:hypothetical protein